MFAMLLAAALRQQDLGFALYASGGNQISLDPCVDVHNAPTAADHGAVRRKFKQLLEKL
jgi:hypothetical protein